MTHDRHQMLLDQLAAYALGVLDGDERAELESHLESGCSECERELAAWSGQLEALADTVDSVEPSEMTRARVLSTLPPQEGADAVPDPLDSVAAPSGRSRSLGWRLAAAAGIVFVAWSGLATLRLRERVAELGDQNAALAGELSSVETQLDATQSKLDVMAAANRIIVSPGASTVRLAGLEAAPEAFGVTFVDPDSRRAVFYASELEGIAADETYQLWFIADGTPVSGGVFEVDEQGRATLLVESVDRPVDNWAVTIEPAGGVPAPTGTMVLLG